MATFQDIVAAYMRDYQSDANQEQRWFAMQPTLDKAISVAALARSPGGKRLSHQRRIAGGTLAIAREALLKCASHLRTATSFEELHEVVESTVGNIRGIGELYVYDTALRIGAHLGMRPKHVYVHAGVREGARNCGFEPSRRRITMRELPAPLRKLEPFEVEDILCIYKSQLAGAAMTERKSKRCFAGVVQGPILAVTSRKCTSGK